MGIKLETKIIDCIENKKCKSLLDMSELLNEDIEKVACVLNRLYNTGILIKRCE